MWQPLCIICMEAVGGTPSVFASLPKVWKRPAAIHQLLQLLRNGLMHLLQEFKHAVVHQRLLCLLLLSACIPQYHLCLHILVTECLHLTVLHPEAHASYRCTSQRKGLEHSANAAA